MSSIRVRHEPRDAPICCRAQTLPNAGTCPLAETCPTERERCCVAPLEHEKLGFLMHGEHVDRVSRRRQRNRLCLGEEKVPGAACRMTTSSCAKVKVRIRRPRRRLRAALSPPGTSAKRSGGLTAREPAAANRYTLRRGRRTGGYVSARVLYIVPTANKGESRSVGTGREGGEINRFAQRLGSAG